MKTIQATVKTGQTDSTILKAAKAFNTVNARSNKSLRAAGIKFAKAVPTLTTANAKMLSDKGLSGESLKKAWQVGILLSKFESGRFDIVGLDGNVKAEALVEEYLTLGWASKRQDIQSKLSALSGMACELPRFDSKSTNRNKIIFTAKKVVKKGADNKASTEKALTPTEKGRESVKSSPAKDRVDIVVASFLTLTKAQQAQAAKALGLVKEA